MALAATAATAAVLGLLAVLGGGLLSGPTAATPGPSAAMESRLVVYPSR